MNCGFHNTSQSGQRQLAVSSFVIALSALKFIFILYFPGFQPYSPSWASSSNHCSHLGVLHWHSALYHLPRHYHHHLSWRAVSAEHVALCLDGTLYAIASDLATPEPTTNGPMCCVVRVIVEVIGSCQGLSTVANLEMIHSLVWQAPPLKVQYHREERHGN